MTNRMTKSAIVLARALALTLGFAMIQPAFAHNAPGARHGEASMRTQAGTPVSHRHHGEQLRLAPRGYAGPVPAVAAIYAGTEPHFVAGRGIVGEPCDLPSSSCSNDMRIAN